jgi:hypothetical protein
MPVTVEGAIVGAGDGLVALVEKGAESPVAFSVGAEAQIVRGVEDVPLDALRVGDSVRVTIDGMTGSVYRLHAEPVSGSAFPAHVPGSVALLAAVGFIAAAALLAIRNLDRLPAFPARGSHSLTRLPTLVLEASSASNPTPSSPQGPWQTAGVFGRGPGCRGDEVSGCQEKTPDTPAP